MKKLQQDNLQHKTKDYEPREDGILLYKGRTYVPTSEDLGNMILREMHNVPYVGHSIYKKIIVDVQNQ
jgi:hypothetical protein